MDVKIADYGIIDDKCFILYNISGLTNNQLEFLNNNLDDETQIVEDNLLLKTKFKKGSVLKLSNFFLFLF
jgi:hypothetical protein